MSTAIDFYAPIRVWLPTQIYVGHQPGLPDVILGRWPEPLARASGRPFKSWICETPEELRAVSRKLEEPCPITNRALDFRSGPDAAVMSPAVGIAPHHSLVIALYPPPAPGWPWLVLMSLPVASPGMERGRYAWEAMAGEAEALDHIAHLSRTSDTPPTILTPGSRQ